MSDGSGKSDLIGAVTGLRAQLWGAGFRPVPIFNHDHTIKGAGKRPLGDDWGETARRDPPLCVASRAVSHALNTGILCDGLRAVDVDIDDPKLAKQIYSLALMSFGETIMRYRDDSPRVLLLYRAALGQPVKLYVVSDLGKVEILGKGQQFVAFGQHPDTGAELRWMPEAPGEVSASDLPTVSEEDIYRFLNEAAKVLGADPPRRKDERERTQSTGKLGADALQVIAALTSIPNDGPADWEGWNRIGMATWAATGGNQAGRAAFHAWSQANPAYDPAETDARWDHYAKSPPTQLGAGTLFYEAKKFRAPQMDDYGHLGPEPPPPDPDVYMDAGTVADRRTPRSDEKTKKPAEPPLWLDDAVWDEAAIAKRPWIAPGYMLRGSVTVMAGQGSAGKSTAAVCQSISLALARPWSKFRPTKPCISIVYNTEDDQDEQRRRFSAALRQFHARPADLAGRVYRTGPTQIGTLVERDGQSGRVVLTDAMAALEDMIVAFKADVVFLDPLVEIHNAEENDNTALRSIIATFRSLAVRHNVAVVILHHARKGSAGSAGDPDMIRGAGSIVGAARVVLTVSTMTEEEAEKMSIQPKERHDYFRIDGAKANYSRIEEAEWFYREAYELSNGEIVAAAVPWKPVSVFRDLTDEDCNKALDRIHGGFSASEPYTASKRGNTNHRWVGYAIAGELDITEEHAAKVLAIWMRNGLLREEEYRDRAEGKTRKGVVVDHSKRPAR